MVTTRCSISSAATARSFKAKMPIIQHADPGCGPQERRWRDRCVDAGLEDDWLERLNAFAVLDLISICEGHPDEPEFEHRRTPHINFRVKEIHAETIAALWNSERALLAALIDEAFLALPLSVVFEVRSGRELRLGSAADFSLCLLKLKPAPLSLDRRLPFKAEWFRLAIAAIETLDHRLAEQLG